MIRASLYSGTPLGNECFKKKIEVMTGCKVGEVYNIGGRNESNNNDIADKVCEILDDMRPKAQGSYRSIKLYIEDKAKLKGSDPF